jgi:fused signal recognition particle receptor
VPKVKEKSLDSGGLFDRLKVGLSQTRKLLTTDIDELFSSKPKLDDDLLEELEELLITSDMGVQTTMDLIQNITKQSSKLSDSEQLKDALKENIIALLDIQPPAPIPRTVKPHVIMVIGVNGVGKTTTIGKLAARFVASGDQVLIAAADTFRAAAVEQLSIWAQRAGVEIVKHKDKADPAAVAYDGIEAAIARGVDVVLVDTAGRLHTRVNLMEELKKIKRTIAKKLPDAPHEILLILDATTGQNALSQTKMFNDALGVTGIALTKLDGTAKGGIVVSICDSLEIPLKYVGIGEKIEDLLEFDPVHFVNALF